MASETLLQRRRRRGGNAIEFALLFPILLAFLGGIIEYGWYQQRDAQLGSIVRRAARTGATVGTAESPKSVAQAKLKELLTDYKFAPGQQVVEVRGSAPDQVIFIDLELEYTPLVGLVTVPAIHKNSIAMRLEVQGR